MMNVTEEEPVSKWVVYGGMLLFGLLGVAGLFLSISAFMNLFTALNTQPVFISIYKGRYYGFGAGIGSLLFFSGMVYIKVFNKELSHTMNQLLVRLLLGSVALAFILPQIIHYTAANYLEKHDYQVCKARSTQWLFVSTIVYTKSLPCGKE